MFNAFPKKNFLKTLRLKYGIRQLSLSCKSGIPQSELSLIENGWVVMTKKNHNKLEEGFKKLGVNYFSELMADLKGDSDI